MEIWRNMGQCLIFVTHLVVLISWNTGNFYLVKTSPPLLSNIYGRSSWFKYIFSLHAFWLRMHGLNALNMKPWKYLCKGIIFVTWYKMSLLQFQNSGIFYLVKTSPLHFKHLFGRSSLTQELLGLYYIKWTSKKISHFNYSVKETFWCCAV